MHKLFAIFFSIIFVLKSISAQRHSLFQMKDNGREEFTHKTPLKYGALFFKENSIQFVLKDAAQIDDLHGHDIHEVGLSQSAERLKFHVLNKFIDSKKDCAIGLEKVPFKHNYFIGDDHKIGDQALNLLRPYNIKICIHTLYYTLALLMSVSNMNGGLQILKQLIIYNGNIMALNPLKSL